MLTLHVWYYPLPTREGRMEMISLIHRILVPIKLYKPIQIDKITYLIGGRARIRTYSLYCKWIALFLICTDSYNLFGLCLRARDWEGTWSILVRRAPPH